MNRPIRTTVVLMVKAPRRGSVKTRLAREIVSDEAVAVYRQMVERQVAAVPGEFSLEVHFSPAEAEREMRAWLPGVSRFFPQAQGSFSVRLKEAVVAAFSRGADRILLIGGDCPALSRQILCEAGRRLIEARAVIGPAPDGGYYLLGLREPEVALFAGVEWSTGRVLEQTIARARKRGLAVVRLPELEDVDDAASLGRARRAGLLPD